ncbi:MAG: MraY family glycosyltransferase [bacterium]|nr:undecaprenyl/decaprenyl-phosphate alpha-N-acetylglucosaminyl 1-phosphate transferase [Phycisphaerales bacterium]MCE2651953.1 undecaprenyl/decaprenyl-phosphate alpha-N-acetylglucosaminyl 1-phosphate transferase [Planctomycetaceae bacterium]
MRDLVLLLIPLAFAVAVPTTWTVRWLSRRLNAVDTAPLPGQVKAPPRPVPNTGGAAIFLAIAGPIAAMLLLVRLAPGTLTSIFPPLTPHLPGLVSESGPALAFLAGLTLLHVIGLIDDRTPLGPKFKLAVMLGVSAVVVLGTGTRLLTMLDASVGGPWLSVLVTVLWIVAVTNAMNFMDNMDGLTGGVAAIAGGCFLAAALMHDQWFVAACLSLLIGGCLGFLIFNFPAPKASIFMGDGGSLVVGFTLAFLTVRTTYYVPDPAAAASAGWYAVFMPLVVLAVPLYDLASVVIIRLRAGKSPMVGDLNHLSHRLVRRGLSKRDAVLVIYGLTAITAIGGVSLGSLADWQAILVFVQVMLVLLVLALYEGRSTPATM